MAPSLRRLLLPAALLAALLASSPRPAGGAAPVAVQELSAATFDAAVSRGPLFVKVYAPWCGHCRRLEPAWGALASELLGHTTVARVDGHADRTLAARLGVKGFPTLVLLRDGNAWVFEGGRSVDAMAAFARGGYKTEQALPWWRNPAGAVGRAAGVVYGLPAKAEAVYRAAKSAGWSDTGITGAVLLSLLAASAVALAALDAAVTAWFGAQRPATPRAHPD